MSEPRESHEQRGQVLNPIYDAEESREEKKVQFRPFYWRYESVDEKRIDVLAPMYTWREDSQFKRMQIFPFVYYTERTAPEDQKSWWLIGFPFLWVGNDDFLILPFGGYTTGFLGIQHLLMITPLFIRTKSTYREVGEKENTTYTARYIAWPFVGWGSDGKKGGRRKLRIIPFYGYSKDRDGSEAGYVMWPIYTWQRDRRRNREGWMLWPFFGKDNSPTHRRTTVAWPFWTYDENYLSGAKDASLWPFWRHARGGDQIEVRRFWPLAEYRRDGFSTTEWRLWPFWRQTYLNEAHTFSRYNWVLPFYKRVERFHRATGQYSLNTKIWPIGRWELYKGGGKEVAIPVYLPWRLARRETVEPWRPFVSIYHRWAQPNGDLDESAAFGLYLYRRRANWKKTSLLTGLIGWDKGPDGVHLRLFWGLRFKL